MRNFQALTGSQTMTSGHFPPAVSRPHVLSAKLKRNLLTANEAGRSERTYPRASGTYPLAHSQSMTSGHCLLPTVDTLKFFLATAPSTFPAATPGQSRLDDGAVFNSLLLPTGDTISCVLWNGLYHITGTDVVRALCFRFRAIGRPIQHMRKFEEGVFSDLRNLQSGIDAVLEDSKSPFLEVLFRHDCVRTQKKQKVFFWFSVPHDRLFLDAFDRDLRREQIGQIPSSRAVEEPALSFRWDPKRTLYDQFAASALPYAPLTSSPPLIVLAGAVVERSPPCRPICHPVTASVQPCLPRESVTITPASCSSVHQPCHQVSGRAAIVGSLPIFRGSPSYKVRTGPAGVFHLQIGEASVEPEIQGCKRRKTEHVVDGGAIVPPATLSVANDIPPAECSSVVNSMRPPAPLPSLPRATPASQRVMPQNSPFPTVTPTRMIRSFACDFPACRRTFARLEHVQRHIRSHTNDKPFTCVTCAKAFTRSDNLAVHKKIHGRGTVMRFGTQ